MDLNNQHQGNITFLIFTYNDGYRLEAAIRNLRPFGEVIVSDQESTDNCKEIAEHLGAKFISRKATGKPFIETQELLDEMTAAASHDWLFWSNVDYLMPKTLLLKLVEMSHQNKYKIVYIPIYTYLWGDIKNIYVKAAYPSFFRKGFMDMRNTRIHNLGKFIGTPDQVLRLPMKMEYAMRHFSLYDLNKFIPSHARYVMTEAQQNFDAGRRITYPRLFGSMGYYFYLFYGGLKSGMRGVLVGLLYAYFKLLVAVRMFELENNLNLETIEAAYAVEKQKLVAEAESA